MQVVTMAVLSVCWLIAAGIFEVEQSAPLSSLWQGYGDPVAWLVLLWPALGQYSTGEAAQVAGQAKCAPALYTPPFPHDGHRHGFVYPSWLIKTFS